MKSEKILCFVIVILLGLILKNSYCLECFDSKTLNEIYLKYANTLRQRHGSKSLKLSNHLIDEAEKRASELAISNKNSNCQKGEISWQGPKYDRLMFFHQYLNPIYDWYQEINTYRGFSTNNKFTDGFTQLVWKNTKYMGCGTCSQSKTDSTFVVCKFHPPGNTRSASAYEENVPPLLKPKFKKPFLWLTLITGALSIGFLTSLLVLVLKLRKYHYNVSKAHDSPDDVFKNVPRYRPPPPPPTEIDDTPIPPISPSPPATPPQYDPVPSTPESDPPIYIPIDPPGENEPTPVPEYPPDRDVEVTEEEDPNKIHDPEMASKITQRNADDEANERFYSFEDMKNSNLNSRLNSLHNFKGKFKREDQDFFNHYTKIWN